MQYLHQPGHQTRHQTRHQTGIKHCNKPRIKPASNTATNPASNTASNTESHPEYEVINEPLYDRNYYRGTLETRKTRDDTYGTLEYITIMDVFDYATLGHIVPDRYLEQLTKYVT